jgi:hypothetical protein
MGIAHLFKAETFRKMLMSAQSRRGCTVEASASLR